MMWYTGCLQESPSAPVECKQRGRFVLSTRVKSFRLPVEDVAALEAILRREGITLSEWVARRVARAGAAPQVPAQAPAQARAGDDEAIALRAECDSLRAEVARLREETTRAVTLAPEAMAVLEHLFAQCQSRWQEYRGPNGFAQWLADAAFGFVALNAQGLEVDLGRHADGALSATPMLRALVCRAVRDLVLPKRRC